MGRWGGGAIGSASRPICAAYLLLAALLLGAPWAHAASGVAASSPGASGDVSERAAQAKVLLDTPQGATLLDLLGDPAVRERLMASSTAPPPSAASSGAPAALITNSMGFMLNRVLGDTRQRIIDLGFQVRVLPDALR